MQRDRQRTAATRSPVKSAHGSGNEESYGIRLKDCSDEVSVMKKLGVLLVVGLIIGSLIYVVAIFDPFKWGLEQSERFSWSSFEEIKKGDRIGEVIERLGQPVLEIVIQRSALTPEQAKAIAEVAKKRRSLVLQ